jgi:hypothetical protein
MANDIINRRVLLAGLATILASAGCPKPKYIDNTTSKPGLFKLPDERYLNVDLPDVKTEVPNREQVSQEVYSKITKQLGTTYTPISRDEAKGDFYIMLTDVIVYNGANDVGYRIIDREDQILETGRFYDDSGLSQIIVDVEEAMQAKAENERKKSGEYTAKRIE